MSSIVSRFRPLALAFLVLAALGIGRAVSAGSVTAGPGDRVPACMTKIDGIVPANTPMYERKDDGSYGPIGGSNSTDDNYQFQLLDTFTDSTGDTLVAVRLPDCEIYLFNKKDLIFNQN
jgi:hypothetical protein